MEGLTTYALGTFEVRPLLATSWRTANAGRSWIFQLRHGVRFADGTRFDAYAAKFNFDRWRYRANPYRGGGTYIYYGSQFGGFPGVIRAVTVRSPDVLELDLSRPFAPLLADLAMPAFAMSSPAAIRRDPENYFAHPVGTGPYEVAEWVKDDHITLRRFAAYWGARPRIETIVVRDIPDAATTMLALQHGDVDGWEYPRPEDLPAIARDGRFNVYHDPPNNVSFVSMNTQHPPLGDVLVRRAVSEAIDARAIVRRLFDPTATAATEFFPPVVWPRGGEIAYPYDPRHARALLARAGFPHGFSTRLWYMTAPRPYLPEPERVAESVQAYLRAVGIDAKLQGYEFGIFLQRVENGEHDLAIAGWQGDNGDPDNFLYVPLDEDNAHPPAAYNLSLWRDGRFHRLMIAAQTTLDQKKRAAMYLEALRIVREQAPLVPIAHTSTPTVFRKSVRGFVPSPDSAELFQFMSISRESKP